MVSANVAVNVIPIISLDEPILKTDGSVVTDADLQVACTFKKTDASGDNVAFTATIDAAKKVITVTPSASLLNSQAYIILLSVRLRMYLEMSQQQKVQLSLPFHWLRLL